MLHAATNAIVRADAAVAVGRGQPYPRASLAPAVGDYFFSYEDCFEHAGSAAGELLATTLPALEAAVRGLLSVLGARAAPDQPWSIALASAPPACAIADAGTYLVAHGTAFPAVSSQRASSRISCRCRCA